MSALLDDTLGYSALHELVAGQARLSALSEGYAPLLSADFYAQYATDIDGPVLELCWPSQNVLEGVLRAVKHKNALLVVELPAFLYERDVARVHREVAEKVLETVLRTDFERPLTLLSSGWQLDALCKAPVEEQIFRLFSAVEAGFTSFRFECPAHELESSAVEEVFDALSAWGVSAELVIDDENTAVLELVRSLSERGYALACTEGVELSATKNVAFSPLVVVDPALEKISGETCRLRLDSIALAAVKRALRAQGAGISARVKQFGARRVLGSFSAALDEVEDDVFARMKAFSYADVSEFADATGASGTAPVLLDAILEHYEMEQ